MSERSEAMRLGGEDQPGLLVPGTGASDDERLYRRQVACRTAVEKRITSAWETSTAERRSADGRRPSRAVSAHLGGALRPLADALPRRPRVGDLGEAPAAPSYDGGLAGRAIPTRALPADA